ncbi:hypothetical protein HK100_009788, partial [Physocladia obscura]
MRSAGIDSNDQQCGADFDRNSALYANGKNAGSETHNNNENDNAEIVASRVLSAMAAAAAAAAAATSASSTKSSVTSSSPANTTAALPMTKKIKKKHRKPDEKNLLNAEIEVDGKVAEVEVEVKIKVANTATTGTPKIKAERQPAQRPKSYAQKACSHCKNSHVACDAGRPCKRCIRLNRAESCADADRKKRGRPSNAEKDNKSSSSLFLTFAVNLGSAATTTTATPANNTSLPSSPLQSSLRNATESLTAAAANTSSAASVFPSEDSPKNNLDTVPTTSPVKQPANSVKALIASRVEGRKAAAAAAAAVAAAISVSTDASCESSSLFKSRFVAYDTSPKPLAVSVPVVDEASVSACPPTSLTAAHMAAKAAHEFSPTSLVSATVPPAKERRKRKSVDTDGGGGGG